MERLRSILSKVNLRFYQHPYFDRFKPAFFRAWFRLLPMSKGQRFLYNTLYSGWTRSTGLEKVLSRDNFRWQQYTNARYNRELTKFMFSFSGDSSVTRNVNNLLFLTGPEGAGKSWFLHYNLAKMRGAKLDCKPTIVHVNLKQQSCLNFDTFVERVERELVAGILHAAEGHVNEQTALDVYLFNHDRVCFEFQLGKSLRCSLSDDGFLSISPAIREQLHQILALHTLRTPKSTPLLDSWSELCRVLALQYSNLTVEQAKIRVSIELVRSVLMTEEQSQAPSAYFGSLYRTGILVEEFLLDYLNLLGGFHPYNDKSRHDYPHILIVIEELQRLLSNSTCEERAINWLDFLCIRLHNDEGWRSHVPVIVETNMNRLAHREIYDDLGIEENVFTHIEWMGVENESEMCTFLSHIFNQTQAEMIARNVGRNLSFLRLFAESLVTAQKPDFLRHLYLDHPSFSVEEAKFHRKLNEIYLSGETQHLLDKGDLEFHIRHALASFVKMGGEACAIHMIGEELKNTAIYKALMDVGILYPEKHSIYISFSPLAYSALAQRFLSSRPLSLLSKLDYYLFALKDALKIADLTINRKRESLFVYQNPKINWDSDLYDEHIGRRPDPIMTGMPLDDPGRPAEVVFPRAPFISIEFVRPYVTPITTYLGVVFNYPFKYLPKREEYARKGLEKRPPAMAYHKFYDEEKHELSNLPNWGEEIKLGMTKWEEKRTLLRGVYLQENPTKFAEKVKWRHVRRFLKDAKATVSQHYFWQ